MTIRRAKTSLRDVLWEGDTVAATLFVGSKKGVQPRNRKGFCAKQPAVFRQKDLDATVQGIRSALLADRGLSPAETKAALGGSRVAQRGWYSDRRSADTLLRAAVLCREDVPFAVLEMHTAARVAEELALAGRKTDEDWRRWHALQAVAQHMRSFVRAAAGLPPEDGP